MHGHSKADLRNWQLHRAALDKLRQQPELLRSVLALLEGWLRDENLCASRAGLLQWQQMLTGWPLDRVRLAVLDAEQGQALRQCSPLGPVLTPKERWRVLEEIGTTTSPLPTRPSA
ncbi:MAG TPA: hypothetical protein PK640_14480 [Verrucomicrobiota bacterium]|nr:hypothetical protein [Verrucomicrobiota bacterium]